MTFVCDGKVRIMGSAACVRRRVERAEQGITLQRLPQLTPSFPLSSPSLTCFQSLYAASYLFCFLCHMLVLLCPMAPEPLEGDPVQTDRQIDGPFRVNGCILWMNSHNQFLELGVTSPHHGLLSVCISAAREGGGREGVKCRGWHTAAATAAGKSGGHHHTRQGPMQGPPQGQGGLLGPSQRCHKCVQ